MRSRRNQGTFRDEPQISPLELETDVRAFRAKWLALFEQDPQLMDVGRRQNVVAENSKIEYDRVVVPHDMIPRRCGELPELTICRTYSLGLSYAGAGFADRTAPVRVVHRYT